ncbi:AtMMH-1 [Coprinopsis sp. MPI-PUGE-AT-0042]|nr:AtMMH-1 [Coprinopsis sp. MPI-PUGE-AT-0042]
MPELPEVERAVNLLTTVAKGKRVTQVETFPDTIVYTGGITHAEFASEVTGRDVLGVHRYGKVFYLSLSGDGRHPVLHFGMTGMLQVKGSTLMHYREAPRKAEGADVWPPKFCKFVLHLADPASTSSTSATQVAFMDARRLARIRLCASPTKEPPISELGFDPILSMMPFEEFSPAVLRRSCPIKALLLDQSFSAGVDEVLYHARIHPEQRCNTLTSDQLQSLHTNIVYVCATAVEVNADHTRFPSNWLFNHRWGKGKKKKDTANSMLLPDGERATIDWIKVGGRTSAYVVELQSITRPPRASSTEDIPDEAEESQSDLTPLPESPSETSKPKLGKRKAITTSQEPAPARATRRKRK